MAQSQFALSWEAHKRNICHGLSNLQQSGEFVDMTLAADGHFVKVHQVIIALASPYIKELISAAQCPHPVIFLNKISYATLCAILEFIYTGEVLVSVENLNTVVEAGKELHIKGLRDVNLHESVLSSQNISQNVRSPKSEEVLEDDVCYLEISSNKIEDEGEHEIKTAADSQNPLTDNDDTQDEEMLEEHADADDMDEGIKDKITNIKSKAPNMNVMNYTVSNRGSLQLILNRYMYYLKYTNKNSTRQWRCVDYLNNVKCPAHLVTKDDMVLQRISAHTHKFHDKKILKKVHAGAVFSAIYDAERQGMLLKKLNQDGIQSE